MNLDHQYVFVNEPACRNCGVLQAVRDRGPCPGMLAAELIRAHGRIDALEERVAATVWFEFTKEAVEPMSRGVVTTWTATKPHEPEDCDCHPGKCPCICHSWSENNTPEKQPDGEVE